MNPSDNDLNIVIKNITKENKYKNEIKIKYNYLDFTKKYNDYNKIQQILSTKIMKMKSRLIHFWQ